MSRATTGEFGGKKPPVADGIVSFDVRRVDGGYRCVGGEPNFDGVGTGPTAALAIADYCQQYHDSTTGESRVGGHADGALFVLPPSGSEEFRTG